MVSLEPLTLYVLMLYGLGVLVAWPLRGGLPGLWVILTGVLWGALFWHLATLSVLMLGGPLHPLPTTMVALGALLVIWGWRWRARRTISASREPWAGLIVAGLSMVAALIVLSEMDHVFGVPDSFRMLAIGRQIAREGFTLESVEPLTSFGSFITLLQAYAAFSPGQAYSVGLQPALTLGGVLAGLFIAQRALRQHQLPPMAWLAPLLGLLLLSSTYMSALMAQMIHANPAAAVYGFVMMGCLWLALLDDAYHADWWRCAVFAGLGFAFTRIEAPLFLVAFVGLALSAQPWPRRVRFGLILPGVLVVVVWYLYLLAITVQDAGRLLSPTNTLLILGALGALIVFLCALEAPFLARQASRLSGLVGPGLLLVLIGAYGVDAEQWLTNVRNLGHNLMGLGEFWGLMWVIVPGLALFLPRQPALRHERFLVLSSLIFLVLVWLLPYGRGAPYRLGWGDSGNRMLFHLLPVLVFYLSLKAARTLWPPPRRE